MSMEEDILQQKIFDELFMSAMNILIEHKDNESASQLVSSTMLAIAIRLYKSALTPEDYEKFLDSVVEVGRSAKPFGMTDIMHKKHLH
jgi:hypothetical protein